MEKTVKITKKMVLTAIKAMAEDGNMHIEDFLEGLTDEDVVEYCSNEIELLDKKATRSKESAAKKRAEGDEITAIVREALGTEDFEPINEIMARIEDETITNAKVIARIRNLITSGEAEKQEITVEDMDGKRKKIMAYRKLA